MATEVWNGNQGILSVYVSKAKDLPNLNKLDKQNVMLRLRIAHMTRESDVLLRAGQNPVFNHLEKYEITPEVRPFMQVEAYCDRKKKPPILIGRCEIDLLNGIRADPREGYCNWYELKRERNEFAGTIFIELSFTPSVPRSQRERRNDNIEKLDASMVRRPVPPLPGESYESDYEPTSESAGSYMHASAMRDVTPRVENYRESSPDLPISLPPLGEYASNFDSSVDTNGTSASQETNITTTSDTRFHFANLKKLKEKINVFKNANSSINNHGHHSDTPVDIEALQKAIGVTSLDDDESDDDQRKEQEYHGDRRASHVREANNRPSLPPLPVKYDLRSEQSPGRTPVSPLAKSYKVPSSPDRRGSSSPQLPPLPTSSNTREGSPSYRRRPPPTAL